MKPQPPLSHPEVLRRLRRAGLRTGKLRAPLHAEGRSLPDLEERVALIESFFNHWQPLPADTMIFFVMYDIEDHKVRHHLAKYLLKQGCVRMQKSVYLGRATHKIYREIADTIREINAMYQNGDSILLLPVTQENMAQFRLIGKDVDYKMKVSPPKVLII